MTLEGIFGVPVDVSSSLIILFTIYGAFLQHSGAGKFFIDFSLALMGSKANSAGRTVVLSSFLLGGPSGSGVATTVTIGAVAYPMLEQGRLREERRRRIARRRRARRDHLAAGARRRRLPDRRVPQDQLPRRDLDGGDPDLPLLPLAAVHGRARRAASSARAIVDTSKDLSLWQLTKRYWLPLPVADLDHRLHAVGLFADAVGVLVDGADLRAELPAPARPRLHAEAARCKTLADGSIQRADRGHHLRHRRHHRRRRHADRARPEVQLDRDRLRRRQPAADRDLHRADRLDRRPRRAGHRLLHHLRGDRGAGA